MRRLAARLAIASAIACLVPGLALAAGYAIYEQGAKALGMAGAFTASANDPSAVFFNPANLTRMEGRQIQAGGTLLQPVTSFAGWAPYPGFGVTEEMESQAFFPPTFYYTSKVSPQFAYGVGVGTPFGLGVKWKDPERFTGRYLVTHAELKTLNATANAAWAFNPQWSVAAGFDALFSKVELERFVLAPIPGGGGGQANVAKTVLESDFTPGYGWNAAISYRPLEQWQFGAFYRSKVVVDVEGDADFTQIPTGNATVDANVAASLPPDQPVKTVLRFPATWSAGVAWMPNPAWTLEADFNYVEWSVFEDLPLSFQTTPSANATVVEDYDDSWQIRTGFEHRLDAFTYRMGWYYDYWAAPTESVTPLLPDAGRNGVTLGLGKSFGPNSRWTVNVYELALFVQHRSTEGRERDGFDGEYRSYVNAAGFDVSYHF